MNICISYYSSNMSYVVKLNNITEETIDNLTIKTKLLNVSTAHNRL